MTTLVLDAGALIALDRNDRGIWAMIKAAAVDKHDIQVPAGAIGLAWRSGARQALLACALEHCDEVALDGPGARAAGLLCGQARTSDVIDASVALTAAGAARRGSTAVLTSDAPDIRALLSVLSSPAVVVGV